jgi:prepilin-type processing-associated H-X9-DG protein
MGAALLVVAGPQGNGGNYLRNNDIFFCPNDDYRRPFRDPVTGWGPFVQTTLGNYISQSYWHWFRPDRYPNLTTGLPATNLITQSNSNVATKYAAQKMFWSDQYIPVPPANATITNDFKNFHKDGMNVLYLDGHAKFVRGSQLADYARRKPYTNPNDYWRACIEGSNELY